MEFSEKMEKTPNTLYKHNPYQATVVATVIALNKKLTFLKLPTASGKTYGGGMLGSFSF
jgi:hypothetical protein